MNQSQILIDSGIKIDLGVASMVRGKKMFDRLVYAFTNVLVDPVRWLFVDLLQNHPDKIGLESVVPFKPTLIEANVVLLSGITVPAALVDAAYPDTSLKDVELEAQLLEYLGLLFIHSPSTLATDNTDPSLCLYQVPDSPVVGKDLVHVNYRGLLPPSFVRKVLETTRQEESKTKTTKAWWASRIASFDGKVHVMANTSRGMRLEWSV
jgi:ribonuclease P/MRP protein subunit RPP40